MLWYLLEMEHTLVSPALSSLRTGPSCVQSTGLDGRPWTHPTGRRRVVEQRFCPLYERIFYEYPSLM
jgi:hypothetical protein